MDREDIFIIVLAAFGLISMSSSIGCDFGKWHVAYTICKSHGFDSGRWESKRLVCKDANGEMRAVVTTSTQDLLK